VFKSKLEKKLWKQLPHKRKDIKLSYETCRLDYVVKKTYLPDVVVDLPNGRRFFIEIKGWFRPEDRTKMIATKAFNPDLDIRLVFDKDNPINKGSKTRYSDWANKNGFQYAVGEIPKEWFQV
jgi:predicted nuclease of restriction endonuclease-like RecB superfamily